MPTSAQTSRIQRIELILEQVESLPTLSPIAMRLLEATSGADADTREVISLVEADVSLTTKLLAMCRRADTGLGDTITTVDRAVVMLGFDAVRSALLSVHLHDMMTVAQDALAQDDAPDEPSPGVIDRVGLWRHSLAVACAAEQIVETHRDKALEVAPEEAFVCGLLHDLGKYALDLILPRSFAQVARLAHDRQIDIADMEMTVIGVDHYTIGKRLAEHWMLPLIIQDAIWLHGQPCAALTDLPHRSAITIVKIADLLARRLHLGWSGDFSATDNLEGLCAECGLDARRVRSIEPTLLERVGERAKLLGVDNASDADLAFSCVSAANQRLSAMNANLQRRTCANDQTMRILSAIASFHASAGASPTLSATFVSVVRSATSLFGDGFYAIVHQSRVGRPWRICQCSGAGRIVRSELLDPPDLADGDLAKLIDFSQLSSQSIELLSWLSENLSDADDLHTVKLLPLVSETGRPAALLHNRNIEADMLASESLKALTSTWSSAIAASAQHDGARRLGERLAEANRTLTETQSKLTEASSRARLGELAAGAAHEMNNPLTIISGRSQMLLTSLNEEGPKQLAQAIADAAQSLSALITGLHFFADPPEPQPETTDLTDLMTQLVQDVKASRLTDARPLVPVKLILRGPLPPAWIDPAQIALATTELLQNALDAGPQGFVELRLYVEGQDGRLVIQVTDDGCGMSRHALSHAFDPFFSEKKAGRQVGLGLARALRLVELQGGVIELASAPEQGATARIILPDWRSSAAPQSADKAA